MMAVKAMYDEQNQQSLATLIGNKLMQSGHSVTTVESCTGGGIGYCLTAIAGSSNWFERGYITYSNAAKIEVGVPEALLKKYGAVSPEVAQAMAVAGRKRARSTYALSVTGITGPGGATTAKPVGMVCFAWVAHETEHDRADSMQIETKILAGDRNTVRHQTIIHSLNGLLKILDNPQRHDE